MSDFDFEDTRTIAYDCVLKRPGCAIIQGLMGGTVSAFALQSIGHWLTVPTPDMRLYTVTKSQLRQLVMITRDFNKGKPR